MCALAYASDFSLLDAAMARYGRTLFDKRMMAALLTPEKVLNGDAGSYALSETHGLANIVGYEDDCQTGFFPDANQLIVK